MFGKSKLNKKSIKTMSEARNSNNNKHDRQQEGDNTKVDMLNFAKERNHPTI